MIRASILAGVIFALASASVQAGGVEWEQQAVMGPSARSEFGFAFDSNRNVSVLFGGSADLTFTAVNRETWEWNGTAWSLVNMAGPGQRCDHAQAFDSIRNLTVVFGGYNGSFLGDTWEWNGTSWANVPGTAPVPRADSFMPFDSDRGVMVLFGGLAGAGVRGDTWEYNGTWTQRATTGPPIRWIQRMAYDSDRGVTVMFGGAHPGGLRGDTWEWNGTSWTQINIPGPPARYGHAMAYDPDRHVTVLFGGQVGFDFGVGPLGDTWEYDGVSWTQVPITGPSARTFVKLVYDSNRHRMVLFGGYNGTQMVNDTWELVSQQTGVGESGAAPASQRLELAQNAPNPFNPQTVIRYRLASDGSARLRIFDVRGALVRTLVDRPEVAGLHAVDWDGRDNRGAEVAGGMYFYRLEAAGSRETRRMALVR